MMFLAYRVGAIALTPVAWLETIARKATATEVLTQKTMKLAAGEVTHCSKAWRVLAISHGRQTLNWRLVAQACDGLDLDSNAELFTTPERLAIAESLAWSQRHSAGSELNASGQFWRAFAPNYLEYLKAIAGHDEFIEIDVAPADFQFRWVFWLPFASWLESKQDFVAAAFSCRKALESMPEIDLDRSAVVGKTLELDARAMTGSA